MNYLILNWGHPGIGALVLVLIGLHELGLRRLNYRSSKAHALRRRKKLWISYAGLALLGLSIVSPLQYWSMQYFWVHMLQHVSVMLAAPALYVAGAPTLPLLFSIPVGLRRRILRRLYLHKGTHPLRRIARFFLSPLFGVIFFNVVMIAWMLPSLFDPVMASESLHIWLMLSSFFISGVLFWIHIIPSKPFRLVMSPFARAGSLLLTNLLMTIIAISLSFFVSVPSYNFGSMMMMMGSTEMPMRMVTLNRFADQQIGAGILWVCGDFWCFPALFLSIRSALRDSEGSGLLDRFLRGQRSLSAEEYELSKTIMH